jgi:hypothetical protein
MFPLKEEKEELKEKSWDPIIMFISFVCFIKWGEKKRVPKEPKEAGTKDCRRSHPTIPYMNLRKGLQQWKKKNIKNLPIPSKQSMFPG